MPAGSMAWRMVVGLGNPGREYERTPHNVGFRVVESLAVQGACAWRKSWRFSARVAEWRREGVSLLLVQPMTFMNASGQAVEPMLRKRGWKAEQLIVVLDDADLALGSLRIRPRGSAGGHRGLQSLVERLGTDEIVRVRIGVGRRSGRELVDHVLSPFSRDEEAVAREAVDSAVAAVLQISDQGVEWAMNRLNRTVKSSENEGAVG
jgi:PTH1 family peptidyl-tRNA hydrolase